MCGIFGFQLRRPLNDQDIALGRSGMASLSHRGPDHSKYWTDRDKGIFLGHTRLSIIDLSEQSNQPMVRNGAVLAYNGEIYNYKELAEQLSAEGVTLTTTGDAEVLLRSWQEWGRECVDRFDGMFAFALHEGRDTHLVTDPFGEKPMYWANVREGVYFASEPKPLVELLNLPAAFSAARACSAWACTCTSSFFLCSFNSRVCSC